MGDGTTGSVVLRERRHVPRRGTKPKEGTDSPSAARRVDNLDSSVEQLPGAARGRAAMRCLERWGTRRHRHGTRRGRCRVGGSIALCERPGGRASVPAAVCFVRMSAPPAGLGLVSCSVGRWSLCAVGSAVPWCTCPGFCRAAWQQVALQLRTGGVATLFSRATGGGAERRSARSEHRSTHGKPCSARSTGLATGLASGEIPGPTRTGRRLTATPQFDPPSSALVHQACRATGESGVPGARGVNGWTVWSEQRQEGNRPQ